MFSWIKTFFGMRIVSKNTTRKIPSEINYFEYIEDDQCEDEKDGEKQIGIDTESMSSCSLKGNSSEMNIVQPICQVVDANEFTRILPRMNGIWPSVVRNKKNEPIIQNCKIYTIEEEQLMIENEKREGLFYSFRENEDIIKSIIRELMVAKFAIDDCNYKEIRRSNASVFPL